MRDELNSKGGCTLYQEEALGDLLRANGLAEAISTRSPIGDDCYDAQSDDVELLRSSSTGSGPTVCDFQSLVGSCSGLRDVHGPTSHSQHTRLRDRHTRRVY